MKCKCDKMLVGVALSANVINVSGCDIKCTCDKC